MTNLVSDAKNPPRKFLKLTVLEMEKVRRSKEKHSARERIEDIDKRLVEIEAEQTDLLKLVEIARQGDTQAAGVPSAPREAAPETKCGVTLRY